MGIIIRALKPSDKSAWRFLWTGYLEFYESAVTEDVYETTFARLLDPEHKRQQALVAEEAEELVGLVHFIYHPHNWRVEDACYLQDLFTRPDVRGKGVGRALIEAVYKAADESGTPFVYWLTQDFNQTARKLYDNIGHVTPFIKYQR